MKQLHQQEMHLSNRQGAIAYNIGAAISYVSLVMLLMDAVHVAKQHDPVTWARFGFVVSWLIGAFLKAPYKWDRLWLRVSTLIQILFIAAVTCLYIEAGIA